MIKINLLVCLLLFCSLAARAQPTMDTIKYCLTQKPKPFVKLDSRNSFVDNNIVNIFGIVGGLNYDKRLRFGIGYNQLYNPPKTFTQQVEYLNALGKPYFIATGLRFYYFSIAIEYSFYQTKHWMISMPLQIGLGKTYYQYEFNNIQTKIDDHIGFTYEPAISIDYKIVKWVGVKTDFGYRFFATTSKKLNNKLNSPTITFGLLIYYSEIYKSIFQDNK